ncbi:MAG: TlpA family protein disulfide reductase [Flavobacteriales bacterium]|nr:TlpA family protein disulfide reductase [Flavobacteriales bacterium]
MKNASFFLVLIAISLLSCGDSDDTPQDPKGLWRGRIMVDRESQGKELPFLFEVREKRDSLIAYFINGTERFSTNSIRYTGDSIFIRMDPYDSEIQAKITGSQMLGVWMNYSRGNNYHLPFHARAGENQRFYFDQKPVAKISGRFKVQFGEVENAEDAIAEFVQNGNLVIGTFLTETGDYRYLEGSLDGDHLQLSCFDGAHAFLFEATVHNENKIVSGRFYSGSHYETSWKASRNEKFKLRKPTSITGMQPGAYQVYFTLQDLENRILTPDHFSLCNKVILVQIMGTWCPNCRDQTNYLKQVYEKFGTDSLEIIAVGFEPEPSVAAAKLRLVDYREHFGIKYRLAYGGKSAKKSVHLVFPGLEAVKAYPTLIYIDKKGNVQRIHAGFSGPATSEYTNFVSESDSLIQALIHFNYDSIPSDTSITPRVNPLM